MKLGLKKLAVAAGFLAPAFACAPASADPPAPGSPVGDPYYSPPGMSGSIPGNFTYSGTFEWVRPRRSVDSAGIGAMTNADPSGSGLPGSHLGVEPQRYGPNGAVSGIRLSTPQQSVSSAPAAGGVMPGASPAGLEDPSGKAPKKPIKPESAQPDSSSTTALPGTTNTEPDTSDSSDDDSSSNG